MSCLVSVPQALNLLVGSSTTALTWDYSGYSHFINNHFLAPQKTEQGEFQPVNPCRCFVEPGSNGTASWVHWPWRQPKSRTRRVPSWCTPAESHGKCAWSGSPPGYDTSPCAEQQQQLLHSQVGLLQGCKMRTRSVCWYPDAIATLPQFGAIWGCAHQRGPMSLVIFMHFQISTLELSSTNIALCLQLPNNSIRFFFYLQRDPF